jgi:hypothetical protein
MPLPKKQVLQEIVDDIPVAPTESSAEFLQEIKLPEHEETLNEQPKPKKARRSKSPSDEFNTLTDWVDEQEVTKETLKKGLLSFLKHVEKVEDEKLHRKG